MVHIIATGLSTILAVGGILFCIYSKDIDYFEVIQNMDIYQEILDRVTPEDMNIFDRVRKYLSDAYIPIIILGIAIAVSVAFRFEYIIVIQFLVVL